MPPLSCCIYNSLPSNMHIPHAFISLCISQIPISLSHYISPFAFSLCRQILPAIRNCHEKGIVHRDIKPDNILVNQSPRGKLSFKLADFGLSVCLIPGEYAQGSCGSPCYSAPEVWSGARYAFKADIWSLGVSLYQILYGNASSDCQSQLSFGFTCMPPIMHFFTRFYFQFQIWIYLNLFLFFSFLALFLSRPFTFCGLQSSRIVPKDLSRRT
jgi:serine/threonine protein kinase